MWYSQAGHKKNSWGYHLIIDAIGCNDNIKNKQKIIEFIEELVSEIEMNAVGEPVIQYLLEGKPNAGYSLMQLIETSSITCHFIEENSSLYLDVFSCKDFDDPIIIKVLNKYFEPTKYKKKILYRDATEL